MADETSVDVYSAIASPVRRAVLDLVADGPMRANDIAERFGISRPAVSQHLGVLTDAGLLERRRLGREIHYSLSPRPLEEVRGWLARYERFWEERHAALGDLLDRRS